MKLWFTNKYKATERRKLSYGVPNTTVLVNLILITISNLVVIYNYFHYSCNLSYLFNFLKLNHLKYFLKLKWIKKVWVLSCHEQCTNKKYWVFISTWTPTVTFHALMLYDWGTENSILECIRSHLCSCHIIWKWMIINFGLGLVIAKDKFVAWTF